MSIGINPPRYPALERAMASWGMPEPDAGMVRLNDRLANLRRFSAGTAPTNPEPPIKPKHPRGYWQARARAMGIHLVCLHCADKGWIAVPDMDDVGYEPCRCQNHVSDKPYDERPF